MASSSYCASHQQAQNGLLLLLLLQGQPATCSENCVLTLLPQASIPYGHRPAPRGSGGHAITCALSFGWLMTCQDSGLCVPLSISTAFCTGHTLTHQHCRQNTHSPTLQIEHTITHQHCSQDTQSLTSTAGSPEVP